VHGVCLKRVRDGVRLRQTVSIAMDQTIDPMSLGGADGRAALGAALQEACGQLHGDLGAVCVGLGHGAYLIKSGVLVYPEASRRGDLRSNSEQLLWEIEQYLGDELGEYAVDAVSSGTHGYAVAARLAVLDLYAQIFTEAGMPEPDFDVEPFALHNAAEAAQLLVAASTVVLVGLGGGGADILTVRDGVLASVSRCTRKAGGSRELVASIQQELEAAEADGESGLASAAVWVAGGQADKACAPLSAALGCACEPLPWQRLALGETGEPESPNLSVAAGLAVRSLCP
jgi:Tfp pilus assembly PilM family ATPase